MTIISTRESELLDSAAGLLSASITDSPLDYRFARNAIPLFMLSSLWNEAASDEEEAAGEIADFIPTLTGSAIPTGNPGTEPAKASLAEFLYRLLTDHHYRETLVGSNLNRLDEITKLYWTVDFPQMQSSTPNAFLPIITRLAATLL